MGRVNIVYSLIQKSVLKKKIIKTAQLICSKSRYTLGDPNYMIIALATMLARNNKVPFGELLYNLLPLDFKIFSSHRVLAQARLPRLAQIIGMVLKGKKSVSQGFMTSMMFAIFESDFKQKFITKIINCYGQYTRGRVITRPHSILATEVLAFLIPSFEGVIRDAISGKNIPDTVEFFLLNNLWFSLTNFLVESHFVKPFEEIARASAPNVFSGFAKIELFGETTEERYNDRLSYSIESGIGKSPTLNHPKLLELTLDKFFHLNETVDSMSSLVRLVERAKLKLYETPVPPKDPNGLKIIKFLIPNIRKSAKFFIGKRG
jgi:hypothetical protein